jgi:hypothetical protein
MMPAKEIFLKTLNHEHAQRVPCAPHWWGIYKYELPGHEFRRDGWTDGTRLSQVYIDFYEKFKPDWFHLHIGTPNYFRDSEIVEKRGKSYLRIDSRYRNIKKEDKYFSVNSSDDEEIVDFADYLLGSRCAKPKVDLSSPYRIDEFIKKYVHLSAEEITSLGYIDHIPEIVRRYGDEVFIAVHIPSAVCEIFDPNTGYIGFDHGLMAFHDYPEGMRYLIERCYREQLEWVRAYGKTGIHAYCISEAYISPDVAGPQVYRDYLKSVHRDYFKEVALNGMVPICNFWGDVNPIFDDLKEINIRALMVEESKKTFDIDVCALHRRAEGTFCLFGNLDSITLLHSGNPEEIRREVMKQSEGSDGFFIVANGSPITPGTPSENIHTLIQAAGEALAT